MIRKIHWANAAVQLDTILHELTLAEQHHPGFPRLVVPFEIFKCYISLQRARVDFFAPLEVNIGFPIADAAIAKHVDALSSYTTLVEPENGFSVLEVMEYVLTLRHKLERAKLDYLAGPYRVRL
jgi:hypothetical protein